MRKYLILVPLVALLALAIYLAIFSLGMLEGSPMPAEGHITMWLGIVFSMAFGCGLMALALYSSHQGYDDAVSNSEDPRQPKA